VSYREQSAISASTEPATVSQSFKTRTPLALTLLPTACGGGSGELKVPAFQTTLLGMFEARSAAAEVELTPVSASASSSERGELSAAAAIDNNENTRWSSGFSDDESLTLDFGKSELINSVSIDWENAHATQYLVQVSDDNAEWTTIRTVDNSQDGTEDLSGLNGQERYPRIKGVKRSTPYGYSIFEVRHAGCAAAPPEPGPIDTSKPGVSITPVAGTSGGHGFHTRHAGSYIYF
jgi:hypothetical protein